MVASAPDATVYRCKPSLPGRVSKHSAEAVGPGGGEGGALRGKEQGGQQVERSREPGNGKLQLSSETVARKSPYWSIFHLGGAEVLF